MGRRPGCIPLPSGVGREAESDTVRTNAHRFRWLAALLVVAATALLPACSGWQCSKARLALTPIDGSGLGGPVTLEVRLTSGGDPVRGAPISFFVLWEDPDNPDRGRLIGHADTDTDGEEEEK